MLNNGTGRNDTFAAFHIQRAVEARQWFEDGDHPAVRRTSYMEVANLLETSGCSKHDPYWVWSAMGIIELPNGKVSVCPGDWIITAVDGSISVVADSDYSKLYYHQTPDRLSDRISTYLSHFPDSADVIRRALELGMNAAQFFERQSRKLGAGKNPSRVYPLRNLTVEQLEPIARALRFLLDYELVPNTTGGLTITALRPIGDVLYDQNDATLAASLLAGRSVPTSPSPPRNGEYTETCVARRIVESVGPHIAICSSHHQLERIRDLVQMHGVAFVVLDTKDMTRAQIVAQIDAVQPFFKLYRHAVVVMHLLSIRDFRDNDLAFCAEYTLHSTQPLSRAQYIRAMKVLKPEAIPADEETIPLRPLNIMCETPKL